MGYKVDYNEGNGHVRVSQEGNIIRDEHKSLQRGREEFLRTSDCTLLEAQLEKIKQAGAVKITNVE